jgi:nucleoside-diphosphate kinase
MLDRVALGFVKPDAADHVGQILARIESHGFRVAWLRTMQLDDRTVRALYDESAERPFFGPLVEFTLSGMVTVFVLQDRIVWGDHHPSGQARFRSLLGASDSTKSEPGTLRYEFGTGPGPLNAIHATESVELIKREAMILGVWEEVQAIAERRLP